MVVRASSGSGGGGGSATYDIQNNLAPNTNYTVTLNNGFVLLANAVYDTVWVAVVVENGVATLVHKQNNALYSYSGGVLTVKNAYTPYGNTDYLATYVVD